MLAIEIRASRLNKSINRAFIGKPTNYARD
jgi:hypothetical protein